MKGRKYEVVSSHPEFEVLIKKLIELQKEGIDCKIVKQSDPVTFTNLPIHVYELLVFENHLNKAISLLKQEMVLHDEALVNSGIPAPGEEKGIPDYSGMTIDFLEDRVVLTGKSGSPLIYITGFFTVLYLGFVFYTPYDHSNLVFYLLLIPVVFAFVREVYLWDKPRIFTIDPVNKVILKNEKFFIDYKYLEYFLFIVNYNDDSKIYDYQLELVMKNKPSIEVFYSQDINTYNLVHNISKATNIPLEVTYSRVKNQD